MPSETAFTRTIRAALVPNRLRTTLHTVQNASRRTQSSQSVSFASLRFSLGCPLEVRERCVPVRLTEPRDTTSMSASVLVRLDHGLGSCLSAPISHGQRYVRPTFAILHFKDEHPVHRAITDCPLSRVSPGGVGERCGSRRNRPLRPADLVRRVGVFCPNSSSSAGTSDVPVTAQALPASLPTRLERPRSPHRLRA